MAHPGSDEHQIIINKIRHVFGTLFYNFGLDRAGMCVYDTFSAILTEQFNWNTTKIKHPAAYPDLVLWCDEGGNDLSVVIIEIGKFNNIHKLSRNTTDPIIHVGFEMQMKQIAHE